MDSAFRQAIADGYSLDEPGIVLGSAMHGGELLNGPRVLLTSRAGQSILRGVFDTILRGGRKG